MHPPLDVESVLIPSWLLVNSPFCGAKRDKRQARLQPGSLFAAHRQSHIEPLRLLDNPAFGERGRIKQVL